MRQTYSDGSVVDWSGPESSETPAPTVEAVSSLGGGGSSTLGIVALVIAGIALVVAIGALVTRGGEQAGRMTWVRLTAAVLALAAGAAALVVAYLLLHGTPGPA